MIIKLHPPPPTNPAAWFRVFYSACLLLWLLMLCNHKRRQCCMSSLTQSMLPGLHQWYHDAFRPFMSHPLLRRNPFEGGLGPPSAGSLPKLARSSTRGPKIHPPSSIEQFWPKCFAALDRGILRLQFATSRRVFTFWFARSSSFGQNGSRRSIQQKTVRGARSRECLVPRLLDRACLVLRPP